MKEMGIEDTKDMLSHWKGQFSNTTYRLWIVSLAFAIKGNPNLYTTALSHMI